MKLTDEIINLFADHKVTINEAYALLDQCKDILKHQLNVAPVQNIYQSTQKET